MLEFNRSFHIAINDRSLDFDLVTPEKNVLGGYWIVPKNEADLPEIQKLFEAVKADKYMTISNLSNRLKVLDGVSDVNVKLSGLISRQFPQNERIVKLIRMVKNLSRDADIRALCRVCLKLNNQDPHLALAELKSAFRQADSGRVSEKVKAMLFQIASDKNVEEIQSFGRAKTVDVTSFIKALPLAPNGAIDLTKMKKIGAGGTQDIFILKGQPAFVLKIIRSSLTMQPEEREEKYQADKIAYQNLHQSFAGHCTVEQLLLRSVADNSGTKEALISIADFEPGFSSESKIGLMSSYFDANKLATSLKPNTYEKMLVSLFFPDQEDQFDPETFLSFNPDASSLAHQIKTDPDFKAAMKEFLTQFKEYFSQTGQYLDILGRDNIIFFKEGDHWTFKLGTVIKSETREKLSQALDWMALGAERPRDNDSQRMLSFCLHWTKTLNALGMLVGLGRVIDDANCKRVSELWNHLKAAETLMPLHTDRILEIGLGIEQLPPEEILPHLADVGFNPQEEIDLLMDIFSGFTPEKQVILAKYLDQQLPRADSDNPNFRFCSDRFRMANSLMEFPEGKALALSFLKDVAKDPQAPMEEVQKNIKMLEIH